MDNGAPSGSSAIYGSSSSIRKVSNEDLNGGSIDRKGKKRDVGFQLPAKPSSSGSGRRHGDLTTSPKQRLLDTHDEHEEEEEGADEHMAEHPHQTEFEGHGGIKPPWERGMLQMEIEDCPPVGWKNYGQWRDLRSLLFESTPSLLLSLVGLVFTGELLEHVARWRVFRRVDELFILVPMISNLKGNLEMCLSARLGTSANIGELDHRLTRQALLLANMTLLCLQALLISSLAAFLSFFLGLWTQHRVGNSPESASTDPSLGAMDGLDGTISVDKAKVSDPNWQHGYTRPGPPQFVMVLATSMAAAFLTTLVLGSFMSGLVVVSRWLGVDPDNITAPLAATLGDLLTLFVLALIGTVLVLVMDTPIPLIAVILMCIAAGWFIRRVLKNEWIKKVARGGWAPLIAAMLISSGAGMILDVCVGRYRGFALLSISMGGVTGSIGAIHANRLSTSLHSNLNAPTPTGSVSSSQSHIQMALSAFQGMLTLFILAFPLQACFLAFVHWAGWIDLSLGLAGWVAYGLTTGLSLLMAHGLTHFFWSRDLDPDSYTLPIHSALVDSLGSILLMGAYEVCIWRGIDVVSRSD